MSWRRCLRGLCRVNIIYEKGATFTVAPFSYIDLIVKREYGGVILPFISWLC